MYKTNGITFYDSAHEWPARNMAEHNQMIVSKYSVDASANSIDGCIANIMQLNKAEDKQGVSKELARLSGIVISAREGFTDFSIAMLVPFIHSIGNQRVISFTEDAYPKYIKAIQGKGLSAQQCIDLYRDLKKKTTPT